ncbi:sensor histidine kinase [Clostridium chrysemydis]|uniref:sensor histidine kinase n=1 Tax=Clostridium chrysemydis TaxID=2665504 RepID=UPI0018838D73|nr:sensor histidine kinase [Clostridium chrysemydis]
MKKSMIYKRLFLIYMGVIIVLVGALDIFFIDRVKRSMMQSKLYINEKVTYDVNDELNKIVNSTNFITKMMYNDSFVLNDIIHFLNTDLVTYSKDKLNKFSESEEHFYRGIEFFTMNAFTSNENLETISFISYGKEEVRKFNRRNQISVEKLPKLLKNNSDKLSDAYFDKNTISFVRKIRDSRNLKDRGSIVLTYNLNEIDKVMKKYNGEHDILILDPSGNSVYNSKGEYKYEPYEYFEKIEESKDIINLEQKYYISKTKGNSDLLIVSKFKKSGVKIPIQYIHSLVIVDIILLVVSIGIVISKLRKFSDRTDKILIAMESVKSGKLDVEIPISSKDENDEIKYISENFNDMCTELNENIEKSYRAELNQKKAEMVALQNQINPHFLYNTLEGIRMKAICNGDREVSKMLYTLAFLFRKQVKDKSVILLKDELEYCTKYIEIFKFRYEDSFDFKIDCDEEVLNNEIVKFTLQPIIENYFVHGIRLDREDNLLRIEIKRYGENILISVIDNGNGISDEKLEELNNSLRNRTYKGKSIGLTNANERIVIAYGEEYGIGFEKNKGQGVMVVVKLPFREE